MPTAPQSPTEYHYDSAEHGLNDLGRLGMDDTERAVEVLVALVHAVLAIAATLVDRIDLP
jgi:hypothetical protein